MTAAAYRAQRVPADDHDRQVEAAVALVDANAIRAAAEAEAARLIASARDEAKALIDAATLSADEVARANTQRAEGEEMRAVLTVARQLEQRFDALSPWLEQVVGQVVTQIIGSLEPEDRHRRILAEALATARPAGEIRLRVPPEAFAAALAGTDGLCPVVADASLSKEMCVLDCEGGLLDLSISAQLSALLDAMGSQLKEPAP